ncbi:hypothetical protein EBGED10_35380 [Bacillus sp. GeD10]|nr:hypothetical protein EBGED10_35380 [Bacillus sp. GeD10]
MSEAIQLSQIETYIEEWHECYLSELKKNGLCGDIRFKQRRA